MLQVQCLMHFLQLPIEEECMGDVARPAVPSAISPADSGPEAAAASGPQAANGYACWACPALGVPLSSPWCMCQPSTGCAVHSPAKMSVWSAGLHESQKILAQELLLPAVLPMQSNNLSASAAGLPPLAASAHWLAS